VNKQYCLERADYHLRMSREYKADAELALGESQGRLRQEHYDYWIGLAERHERDAKDWITKSNGVGME